MPFDTFVPPKCPTVGSTQDIAMRVRTAQFGDGYKQEAPDGLNSVARTLSLEWPLLSREEAAEIIDFLEGKQGSAPFVYLAPGEDVALQWTCKQPRRTSLGRGRARVSATFEQSFSIA